MNVNMKHIWKRRYTIRIGICIIYLFIIGLYLMQKVYDEKLKALQILQKRQLEERNERKQKEQKDKFLTNFQLELDKKKRELAEGNNNKPSSTAFVESKAFDNDTLVADLSDESLEDEDGALSSELSNSLSISTHDHIPEIDRSTKPTLNDICKDQLCELIVPYKSIIDKFVNLARKNTGMGVVLAAS